MSLNSLNWEISIFMICASTVVVIWFQYYRYDCGEIISLYKYIFTNCCVKLRLGIIKVYNITLDNNKLFKIFKYKLVIKNTFFSFVLYGF